MLKVNKSIKQHLTDNNHNNTTSPMAIDFLNPYSKGLVVQWLPPYDYEF